MNNALRFFAIGTLATFLAACTTPVTSDIGGTAEPDELRTPPGQNGLSIVFDPANPGIPSQVLLTMAKDETDVQWKARYAYPDGPTVVYEYAATKSTNSKAAIAMIEAVELTVAEQNKSARDLGPAVIEGLLDGLKTTLTGGAG